MKNLKIPLSLLLLIFFFQLSIISLANGENENKKKSYSQFSNTNQLRTKYLIAKNRFKLLIQNDGVIADVLYFPNYSQYDQSSILYSAGFYLVGKNNNQIWANGVATASRINDYFPGKVGSNPGDSLNMIYVVNSNDPPFGSSWQEYKNAVLQGAEFYDGDGDGIYNPIDKNGNGKWDTNEDSPNQIGDATAWFVFNDGKPSLNRRFNSMIPLGIEIHQTAFAFSNPDSTLYNTIFFKYKLFNRGLVNNELDSVYFLFWADPDIGVNIEDDLMGSDIILNSVYCYNNIGNDIWYGNNQPAVGLTMLQGPVVYIPNETFIDNNSNGIFDNEIDLPLDTAIVNPGGHLRAKKYFGAKNQNVKSLFIYINSGPNNLNDPDKPVDVWRYAQGFRKDNVLIDPCSWTKGVVLNNPCNQINPKYIFSGNPITRTGWIDTTGSDLRMLISTGPFKLELNEPVEMWFAIVAGRGQTNLNSIPVLKQNITETLNYYKNNIKFEDKEILPAYFILYQNYPNPFNSGTTISFYLPISEFVTLKVYDILGREVTTLVSENLNAGYHSLKFDAGNFSSGVYFYKLQAGKYSETKKMLLSK